MDIIVKKDNKNVKFDQNIAIIGTSEVDTTDTDWMQCARDRYRFSQRISRTGCLINKVLLRKIHKYNRLDIHEVIYMCDVAEKTSKYG